jgi:hypothetical protein
MKEFWDRYETEIIIGGLIIVTALIGLVLITGD